MSKLFNSNSINLLNLKKENQEDIVIDLPTEVQHNTFLEIV